MVGLGWDGWSVTDDGVAVPVGEGEAAGCVGVAGDDDVAVVDLGVVGAADGAEVVGVGGAVGGWCPGSEVVDLEAVGVGAGGDDAVGVASFDHAAGVRRDGVLASADVDRRTGVVPDGLEDTVAGERVE